MSILLPILGVAVAAFCVFLTVRTVNRRKKHGWIFWATVVLVVVLLGYPLSIGPAQWIAWNLSPPWSALSGPRELYAPIQWACHESPRMEKAMWWYVGFWVDYNKMPGVNLPPGVRVPSSWETSPW